MAAKVIANVLALRKARGLSTTALGFELRRLFPDTTLGRSTLTNLENYRRAMLSVDEMAQLAWLFNVEPWSLTGDEPVCLRCQNRPPPGFRCTTCLKDGEWGDA